MQAADTPQVEEVIRRALANEWETRLAISTCYADIPLTVNDVTRIVDCLRENPRLHTLWHSNYSLDDDAVLNVFRDGLPLCTSLTTVKLVATNLSNEDLDRLRPAFYNTSIRKLFLSFNNIQGRHGGELIQDLLAGNITLVELNLRECPIDPKGLGRGLAGNKCLQILILEKCEIGNRGLANLLLSMDETINNSLTNLDLSDNGIHWEEGGQQVSLLLSSFLALKVLSLNHNHFLGPLGARALAPGLAAASQLQQLHLYRCGLENDGVANLVPDGQVNRSLTHLDLCYNGIKGDVGGENVIALASRCTNLNRINVTDNAQCPDQRHRLDMLLERKRLCTEASALGGSPFSVLFRAVEEAHRHEHGLSAIFVILQNDGDDYFCTANNRAIV